MSLIFSFLALFLVFGGIITVIFFNTNPYTSGFLTQFSFFLSLLLAIFSLLSFIITIIMQIKKKHFSKLKYYRRSLFISIAVTGMVVFSSLKVLNLMSTIAFLLAMILLEFFFASRRVENIKR